MEEDAITFEELFDFVNSRVEEESAEFSGDLPNHASSLLVSTANDILQTTTNVDIVRADEDADSPTDEDIANTLEEEVVDLLLALGSLQSEYDLDVSEALRERMSFVENYKEFQEKVEDVESEEKVMEIFEETMDESMEEVMGGMGIEAGDNVDDDDYEPEGVDRGVM
jgi:hypothetical protein